MSVVDIDQLKLIMTLVGTPEPELMMKMSSESVSAIPPSYVPLSSAAMPIVGSTTLVLLPFFCTCFGLQYIISYQLLLHFKYKALVGMHCNLLTS